MKAVLMHATGNPDVLQFQDIASPEISTSTDVLVRLNAAGVNPIDTKLRRGLYPVDKLPTILGCDGAGIVEKTGDKVRQCKAGDPVYFFHGGIGGVQGNYAENIVLDERYITRKPESIDFIHAAAAPLAMITAWETLHDRAQIKSGDKVLIHAGAGGVGHIAIQMAKQAGAYVYTTVSSHEKADFVKMLGADKAINYHEQDFIEFILDSTKGKGVDMAMDNVGGPMIESTFPAIRHYGDMVTLLQPDADVDWSIARQRNLRFSMELMLSPVLFNLEKAQRHQTWILKECTRLIDNNQLKIHVDETFTLEQAAKAHTKIEGGSITGKIVLEIE